MTCSSDENSSGENHQDDSVPQDPDVLFGQDSFLEEHPGTIHWAKRLRRYVKEYSVSEWSDRELTKRLAKELKDQKGSRFLVSLSDGSFVPATKDRIHRECEELFKTGGGKKLSGNSSKKKRKSSQAPVNKARGGSAPIVVGGNAYAFEKLLEVLILEVRVGGLFPVIGAADSRRGKEDTTHHRLRIRYMASQEEEWVPSWRVMPNTSQVNTFARTGSHDWENMDYDDDVVRKHSFEAGETAFTFESIFPVKILDISKECHTTEEAITRVRIHWKGFSNEHDAWMPIWQIIKECQEVQAYARTCFLESSHPEDEDEDETTMERLREQLKKRRRNSTRAHAETPPTPNEEVSSTPTPIAVTPPRISDWIAESQARIRESMEAGVARCNRVIGSFDLDNVGSIKKSILAKWAKCVVTRLGDAVLPVIEELQQLKDTTTGKPFESALAAPKFEAMESNERSISNFIAAMTSELGATDELGTINQGTHTLSEVIEEAVARCNNVIGSFDLDDVESIKRSVNAKWAKNVLTRFGNAVLPVVEELQQSKNNATVEPFELAIIFLKLEAFGKHRHFIDGFIHGIISKIDG